MGQLHSSDNLILPIWLCLEHGNSCSPWNHTISITVYVCIYFDQISIHLAGHICFEIASNNSYSKLNFAFIHPSFGSQSEWFKYSYTNRVIIDLRFSYSKSLSKYIMKCLCVVLLFINRIHWTFIVPHNNKFMIESLALQLN